ncbi:MAG TPA: hypothetical protein VM140_10145 [Burkholderiales bacterium]|nr:hypothetical protein [Burkholderiales bacterium]
MLPAAINGALVISGSMALLASGHPDALPEVQRQMRLINQAYPDPGVLRLTDECVRYAAALHGMPGGESEDSRRRKARAAVGRLRAHLETLPQPNPGTLRRRARARS